MFQEVIEKIKEHIVREADELGFDFDYTDFRQIEFPFPNDVSQTIIFVWLTKFYTENDNAEIIAGEWTNRGWMVESIGKGVEETILPQVQILASGEEIDVPENDPFVFKESIPYYSITSDKLSVIAVIGADGQAMVSKLADVPELIPLVLSKVL